MKKRYLNIVLTLFLCFTVIFFSATVSAHTGRGGSTEVIAKIETAGTDESEELPPSQSEPASSVSNGSSTVQSGEPVKTGDVLLFMIPAAAAAALFLIYIKRREIKEKGD